jgi:hypothetical protein
MFKKRRGKLEVEKMQGSFGNLFHLIVNVQLLTGCCPTPSDQEGSPKEKKR